MFYLIKQLSIQKAVKVRNIFIASKAATVEIENVFPFPITKLQSLLWQYRKCTALRNILPSMLPEDEHLFKTILPLCQEIYDSYKETVLPSLYKNAVEFNCVSSWDVYVRLKYSIRGMLNGRAISINRPTFSLCTDPWQDDTLVLSYMSKDSPRRIAFTFYAADRRFCIQSFKYPAGMSFTKDGNIAIPGKTVLSDICKMLQMPIWVPNEYVDSYAGNGNSNRPFYMNHDILTKDLPDSVLDLTDVHFCKTFTFDKLLSLISEIHAWQEKCYKK